ncbi:LytR/AlgR family response regulator transcription factor [Inconstantimicrobium mannanitabidum]|uniref:DNA-binding response regulator n=1 Tax=Inconstantimicrobium mannanitabidum TaxID=1604901 RepID=A0ACB5R702_9CLOT|nr:LytTR family DNA-binding domain-containing protein [Clostridium sp. TW13]GKX64865.1 DNA-binding response regulator [Clostridium sp. TW13]
MKIAIVEDNELHQKVILENLRSIDHEKCYEILVFNDASSFLFEFEDTRFDALLLDIEMPDMNGVELAAKVRSIDSDIPIAFITGEKDYVFDGYMVEAIGYLLKPIESKSLQDLMKRIEKKMVVKEPVVLIKNQDGVESVKQSAILYIESNDHKTEVVTAAKVYSSNQKLYEWEEILNSNMFQKIHRCTLVNLNHLQKILKKECEVDNGKSLSIARGQWEPLMQAYLRNQRGKHI